MNATNAAPAQSNQVTVTARAASTWTVTKGRVTSVLQLDTPFTYRVSITLAAGGTQNVTGARFVDTLPPGAQFVAATDGGAYDAGTPHRHLVAGHARTQREQQRDRVPRRHGALPKHFVPGR